MAAAEQWVWLARVRRTQGRKGEVFADILTDFPEKFAERRRLWLLAESAPHAKNARAAVGSAPVPREMELVDHWLHKGGIVLHFAGVDSISAAEELAGMVVAVPQSERAALEEEDVYVGDLIGCVLVDVAQAEPVDVGEIVDVDRTLGPVAMLVVRANKQVSGSAVQREAESEILIPFAKSYLRRVDLTAKRVEMALPEGLAELNR
jgi:16S rRNA processing protein RimM